MNLLNIPCITKKHLLSCTLFCNKSRYLSLSYSHSPIFKLNSNCFLKINCQSPFLNHEKSKSAFSKCPLFSQRFKTFFDSAGEINTNVSKDVVIFEFENKNLFRFLKFFSVLQIFLWGFFADTAYRKLRDTPVVNDGTRELRWFEKINLGSDGFRYAITSLCVCCGVSLFTAAVVMANRSVKQIILHKGGRTITIITHALFFKHVLTVPLNWVSCEISRHSSKLHLPIKVKGRVLHYTLDTHGVYPHPPLFDWTVGLKRKF